MNFFVQIFSFKRPEDRHSFFIYFVSKLLDKSLEMTTVEFYFYKVSDSTNCNCFRNLTFLNLISKITKIIAKITFHICVALKITVFILNVCYSSLMNGNFKVQRKRSIWHVSAFIYSLRISIQQLFLSQKMITGILSHLL